MSAFIALLPVFLVILLGYALRRGHLIADNHWLGVDQICYYVLFPAIIFKEIAVADSRRHSRLGHGGGHDAGDLDHVRRASCSVGMACAASSEWMARPSPACFRARRAGTPSSRWPSSRSISATTALALGGLSAAAMIPLLNVVNVAVLAHFASGRRPKPLDVILSVVKNPFVLSSVGGVLFKFTGLPLPKLGFDVLDMIGRGSLGLALLTVGAGLRLDKAFEAKAAGHRRDRVEAAGHAAVHGRLVVAFWA